MSSLRVFYTLLITQTLSIIGSRMTGIALGIRIFTETGQAAPLLLVSFFNELPAMLVGSLVGVWVDRWDRKRVLMLADTGQAVGSLLLLLSFASGVFQLWHLYVVALAQGIFAMFQEPAKNAVVTLLVPEGQRDRANALQAMSFPLAGVIAPAISGVLYGLVGLTGVIFVDLATFVLAVAALYRMAIPHPPASTEAQQNAGGFWRELAGGFRYLYSRPALLGLVLYFTLLNFLLNGPLGLLLPYLIGITKNEALTGLILAASDLGGFVGTALLAAYSGQIRSRMRVITLAMALVGVMFLVHALTRAPLILAASLFVLFGGLQIWALYTSILQIKIPPDMQGRVFAISGQLGYLGATTSFLLTGPLVDRILAPSLGTSSAGISVVLLGSGAIILVLTLLVYALPALRHLEVQLPDYEAAA